VEAFDNVDPHILMTDLFEIDISASLRKFVENLISNRQLNFVIDEELHGLYTSLKGISQESILSSLLFDIYLRTLEQHLLTSVYCNMRMTLSSILHNEI